MFIYKNCRGKIGNRTTLEKVNTYEPHWRGKSSFSTNLETFNSKDLVIEKTLTPKKEDTPRKTCIWKGIYRPYV